MRWSLVIFCGLVAFGTASAEDSIESPSTQQVSRTSKSEKNDWFEFDRRPHIEIIPKLNLNAEGFSPVSESAGLGADFESHYFILDATGSYDNARKVNDGTVDNTKGHIRAANTSAYYRLPNYWFVGTDATWSQLLTTNYRKHGFGMNFGGGGDFIFQDASLRLAAAYAPSVFDPVNGLQAISFQFMEPSPLRQRHVMFTVSSSISFFHDTLTEPNNPVTTAREKAVRGHGGSSSFGLLFRF